MDQRAPQVVVQAAESLKIHVDKFTALVEYAGFLESRVLQLEKQLESARAGSVSLEKANGATHPEIAQLNFLRAQIGKLEHRNALADEVLEAAVHFNGTANCGDPKCGVALHKAIERWIEAGKPTQPSTPVTL